jgi:hypothetical protein
MARSAIQIYRMQNSLRAEVLYRTESYSMDLFRFVNIENIQRDSPAIRNPRFDSSSNRDLAPIH